MGVISCYIWNGGTRGLPVAEVEHSWHDQREQQHAELHGREWERDQMIVNHRQCGKARPEAPK